MPTIGNQTITGKAFEYACALALFNYCSKYTEVSIVSNSPLITAKNSFESLPSNNQTIYLKGATAAISKLSLLEPRLSSNTSRLEIQLQADNVGEIGDVRDVLCLRNDSWQIGISCKHNHEAVKHSRLSDNIDFGRLWFGYPCSKEYLKQAHDIFEPLRLLKQQGLQNNRAILWSEIENKEREYYIPILTAFKNELYRLDKQYPEKIPELLIRYLIGRNDFYKVIMDEVHCLTKIEAFNLDDTLNRPDGRKRATIDVPRVHFPTRFFSIDFKPKSNNTILVACDEGWNVTMRIHNASSKVEPSLKFDVQLIATPNSILTFFETW